MVNPKPWTVPIILPEMGCMYKPSPKGYVWRVSMSFTTQYIYSTRHIAHRIGSDLQLSAASDLTLRRYSSYWVNHRWCLRYKNCHKWIWIIWIIWIMNNMNNMNYYTVNCFSPWDISDTLYNCFILVLTTATGLDQRRLHQRLTRGGSSPTNASPLCCDLAGTANAKPAWKQTHWC